MNREIPEVFDWVSERAKCTPAVVFELLHNQIARDISLRNSIGPQHGFPKRSFELSDQPGWCAVLQPRHPDGPKGVFLLLTPDGITAKDAETKREVCHATLTLSDDGKCRLKVGDTEHNLWQFRKLLLHDLFFVDQEIIL